MEIYSRTLVQMYQLSILYVSTDVKIDILEGGVFDALFAETELVFDGEKYDVMKHQVRENDGVTVTLRAVAFLQGENAQIVLGVLGLRFEVVSEVEHQGSQGGRVQTAGEVQSRRR